MTDFWIATCALACLALLVADRFAWRPGIWVAKPLAAFCFVMVGWLQSPLDSTFGVCILVGLCLSFAGDVLLIPSERDRVFLAGIASFLLAHVAYCAAFAIAGLSSFGLAIGATLVVPAAVVVMRWLRPNLAGLFARAVPVYVIVIGAMLVLASGASLQAERLDLAAGAVMFGVSDLSVARERFVRPAFMNGLWGLPLYFAAQIVLALSIGRALA